MLTKIKSAVTSFLTKDRAMMYIVGLSSLIIATVSNSSIIKTVAAFVAITMLACLVNYYARAFIKNNSGL